MSHLGPLFQFDRPKKLPKFIDVGALPPLRRSNREPLGRDHAEAVIRTMAEPVAADVLVDAKRDLDAGSLDAFVAALFGQWRAVKFHGRYAWILSGMASVGGDRCALAIEGELETWPTLSDTARKRALEALSVLRRIGTDTALLVLLGVGQREVLPSIALRAASELERAAKERRLSVGALGDHITPSCGLDARGVKVFDVDGERFEVAFDETFHPCVRDAAGAVHPTLPRPDPAWEVMAAQLESIARVQSARLEDAMITERRWSLSAWTRYLRAHPLMVHFTRRLVWGLFDRHGRLARAFRASDDGGLVDVDDEPFELPTRGRVGLVHPLHLAPEARSAWSEQLEDYELVPPFEQLTRPVHAPTVDERKKKKLARFAETRVPAAAAHDGFIHLGWSRDDNLVRQYFQKHYEDGALLVRVHLDPGIHAGMSEVEPPQSIPKVVFRHGSVSLALGRVSPVAFSEVLFAIHRVLGER